MFTANACLRSVALELKRDSETAADAALCKPRLQQYFYWAFVFVFGHFSKTLVMKPNI